MGALAWPSWITKWRGLLFCSWPHLSEKPEIGHVPEPLPASMEVHLERCVASHTATNEALRGFSGYALPR